MKINPTPASRPLAQKPLAAAPSLKKRGVQTAADDGVAFQTVSVPYCAYNPTSDFLRESAPSLQITHTHLNNIMALVLRDPVYTGDLNNASTCAARVYETSVPSEPLLLEIPSYVGAGGIVKANDTVFDHILAEFGMATRLIGFVHPAKTSPPVSFTYQAQPSGILRQLVSGGSVINYWTLDPAFAKRPSATASGATSTASATAAATPSSLHKRNEGGNGPEGNLYTVTILENAWFAGQNYLDFNTLMPTPAPAATLDVANENTASTPPPTLVPHVTTVTSFLPNPTSVVQAHVLFDLKGANTNVAAGFANYGAVVGFAALGAVALVGFAGLSRRARAAAAAVLPPPPQAAAAPALEGDDSV